MRVIIASIIWLLSGVAIAADEGLLDFQRAYQAHEDGRPYDAATYYAEAIEKGLPSQYLPAAEAGFCITRLWLQVDIRTLEGCRRALRHAGHDDKDHPAVLADMLSQMATILVSTEHYKSAEWVVEEFDRRYRNLDSVDLFIERQRFNIARAELLRVNGKPREAAEIAEAVIREGYQRPDNATRAHNEIDVIELQKILLFAAADMGDLAGMRNALERFDRVAMQLRSAEGLEYASVIMMCGAHIVARNIGMNSRKLFGEVVDRTTISMDLLLKSHEKNRQRQLLLAHSGLVQECGVSAFYAALPGPILKALRDKAAGEKEFRQIFDHYAAGRYAETATAIDTVVAALREHPDSPAEWSANWLELLRKYLLDPPGHVMPG